MSASQIKRLPRLGKLFTEALVFLLIFSYASILFYTPPVKGASYLVGDGSRSIFLSDLDNDGDLDIVTANAFADSISILKNTGNGIFETHIDFSVGDMPISVCAADLNNDGIKDIVTANYLSNSVSVLFGNGACSYQDQKCYTVGNGPISVEIADINNDGLNDIITANAASDSITILQGVGNNNFGLRKDMQAGDYARSVTIADFDSNGFLDICTANAYSGTISIFFNYNGVIGGRTDYLAGSLPIYVVSCDINDDGLVELVSVDGLENTVSIWSNDGLGRLGTPISYNVGISPHAVAISDINGDGRKDLVVANADEDSVSILIADGNSFLPKIDVLVDDMPLSVDCGDLDGNGLGDICTANYNSDSVVVLLNGVEFTEIYEPPEDPEEPETPGDAFVNVSLTLRVAGKPGGTVVMNVIVEDEVIGSASVIRESGASNGGSRCGSPNEQSVTICVNLNLSKPCIISLDYAAPWEHGANPTKVIIELNNATYEIKYTFNANNGVEQHVEYVLQDVINNGCVGTIEDCNEDTTCMTSEDTIEDNGVSKECACIPDISNIYTVGVEEPLYDFRGIEI